MPKRGEKARRKGLTKFQVDTDQTQPVQSPPPRENPYVLDWANLCECGQNFMDATCLFYLLSKQCREDTQDENGHVYDVDTEDEEEDVSDADLAPWDSQLCGNQNQERLNLAQSRLRNRFLDGLAEVLARVKGAPEDVAGAYMVEIEDGKGNQRVEIRLARNGGLSEED